MHTVDLVLIVGRLDSFDLSLLSRGLLPQMLDYLCLIFLLLLLRVLLQSSSLTGVGSIARSDPECNLVHILSRRMVLCVLVEIIRLVSFIRLHLLLFIAKFS